MNDISKWHWHCRLVPKSELVIDLIPGDIYEAWADEAPGHTRAWGSTPKEALDLAKSYGRIWPKTWSQVERENNTDYVWP